MDQTDNESVGTSAARSIHAAGPHKRKGCGVYSRRMLGKCRFSSIVGWLVNEGTVTHLHPTRRSTTNQARKRTFAEYYMGCPGETVKDFEKERVCRYSRSTTEFDVRFPAVESHI